MNQRTKTAVVELMDAAERAIAERAFIRIEIDYYRVTDWTVAVWDSKMLLFSAQDSDLTAVCRKAVKKFEGIAAIRAAVRSERGISKG